MLVPNVTIKGCKSRALMSNPLINPRIPATTKPMIMAREAGTAFNDSSATTIPDKHATDPTDKSIPAKRMAKNSPNANKI